MTRFVEQAIARAGLAPILPARERGDLDAVRSLIASLGEIDLLALGAVADAVRTREGGEVVRVHPRASSDVLWVRDAVNELELLRAVAIARITGPTAARIGVDKRIPEPGFAVAPPHLRRRAEEGEGAGDGRRERAQAPRDRRPDPQRGAVVRVRRRGWRRHVDLFQ